MLRPSRSHGSKRLFRRPALDFLEPRSLLATIVVNSAADPVDLIDGSRTTLRQAILAANQSPGADAIDFRIPTAVSPRVDPNIDSPFPGFDPVTQTWRITLASPLPAITDTLIVDGLSQADAGLLYQYPQQIDPNPKVVQSLPNRTDARDGNNAELRLIIDGSLIDRAVFPDPTGFVLDTSHSNLRGLIITGFDVGVDVPNTSSIGNRIQGNSIGGHLLYLVDPLTGEPLPGPSRVAFERINRATDTSTTLANTGDGVRVAATNTAVGGTNAQENNTITAGGARGVWLESTAEGTIVQGNQIGVIGPSESGVFFVGGNAAEGVLVEASSVGIGAPVAGAGNLISANGSHGVRIVGTLATRNRVDANYIGLGPGGGFRFGAAVPGNGGDGVRIENAPINAIGFNSSLGRNAISGNALAGIRLTGADTFGTQIQGNYIGLTADGDAALGNILEGVRIEAGSRSNTVGAGNVVSANFRGVDFVGADVSGNSVTDTFIGTDATGSFDLGNTREGIRIEGSPNNRLIGSALGAFVVSGNRRGVVLNGPGATGTLIQRVVLGLDATRQFEIPNALQGILLADAPANTIGGASPFGNVVAANHGGIEIAGPLAVDNRVQGNFIGVNGPELQSHGDEVDGIFVRQGASRNLIGGAEGLDLGNVIAFNRRDGVRIADQSVSNSILTNSIFENAGQGIDLVPAPGRGPNRLRPAPTLTAVRTSLTFTNVGGELVSRPNARHTIQFFAVATPDANGRGEGRRYLGQTIVVTDGTGRATFSTDVAGILNSGDSVTATATDERGDTSAFSNAISEIPSDLQFQMSGFRVDESAGQATITVVRSGGSGGAATVGYATRGGSAIPDVDYTPVSGTLSFAIGQNSATFTVPILDDFSIEAEETVGLFLGPVGGAGRLGTPAEAVLTIVDDDAPGLFSFTRAAYVVDQGSATATITITRDSAGGGVTVAYATAGGTARPGVDYQPVSGVLTFDPGETQRSFVVPIFPAPDLPEPATIGLALSDPSGGAGLGSPSQATLFIAASSTGLQVSNTNDAGAGSLRQAILFANANPGPDAIEFNIPASIAPGLDSPVPGFDPVTQTWRIRLRSPLPAITDPLTIDGLSQADTGVPYIYPAQTDPAPILILSSPNTLAARDGNDAVLRLIVDGSAIDRDAFPDPAGFVLDTTQSNLRGLVIDGFGVAVDVPNSANIGNRIQGNAIGGHFLYLVDAQTGQDRPAGSRVQFEAIGNALDGVRIAAPNTTLGGSNAQENNTITASGGRGVWVRSTAEGSIVLGNQIGLLGPSVNNVFTISPNRAEGVLVEASSVAVGVPLAGGGNLISANGSHGVRVVGPQATRNRVDANYIGLGPGGGFRFGATVPGNGGDGVRIENAPINSIGRDSELARNTISGNRLAGVRLTGPDTFGTSIAGNYIGLTAGGDAALGNALEGVRLEDSARANTIGAGNVISANLRGVGLFGVGVTDNLIADSLIGTDLNGALDLGNANEGVRIDDAPGNRVIGSALGPLVISGNQVGVAIVGPSATGNLVQRAIIGLDSSRNFDLPNAQQGVLIVDAPANTIGGASPFGNVVAANHGGVEIAGPLAVDNRVQGNFIGVNGPEMQSHGDEVDGVFIRQGASRNLIGGPEGFDFGNVIAFNRRDGVRIEDQSVSNSILTNSIFENAGLGIHLVVDSWPPGPNRLQPAPTLTAVRTSLSLTNIQGTQRGAPNAAYHIQFFAELVADPSGFGEGRRYLGQTLAFTDGTGLATFSADVPGLVAAGESVTATATDPLGDTSEFSGAIAELLGTVQFQMVAFRVDEAAGEATIVVARMGGSGGQASVGYATRAGSAVPDVDYTPVSGTLVFDIGVDLQSFTVPILNDTLMEAAETVGLFLGPATGAVTLGTPNAAVLTIVDDDQPGLFSFTQTVYSVDQDSGTATIGVARSAAAGSVGVSFATVGGTARPGLDYVPVFGMLTFGPGVTLLTFEVPILFSPGLPDGATVDLALGDPSGGAGLGSPNRATLVLTRVDSPSIISAVARPGRGGTRQVVLTFDRPLIARRAVDLRNYGYSVQLPGRRNSVRAPKGFLLGIRSAEYDPVARTVTLVTTQPIRPGSRLFVQVNQVTDVPAAGVGVAGLDGLLLDGDGDGRPGGSFGAILVAPRGRKR